MYKKWIIFASVQFLSAGFLLLIFILVGFVFTEIYTPPKQVQEYSIAIAGVLSASVALTAFAFGKMINPTSTGSSRASKHNNGSVLNKPFEEISPAEWERVRRELYIRRNRNYKINQVKKQATLIYQDAHQAVECFKANLHTAQRLQDRYAFWRNVLLLVVVLAFWHFVSGILASYLTETIPNLPSWAEYLHTTLLIAGSFFAVMIPIHRHKRRKEHTSTLPTLLLITFLGSGLSACIMYLQLTPEMISFINDTTNTKTNQNASLVPMPPPFSGSAPLIITSFIQKAYMMLAATAGTFCYCIVTACHRRFPSKIKNSSLISS